MSFIKRDTLIADEQVIKNMWKDNNSFNSTVNESKDKIFVTFPFPYQNGALHLGHAYTLSKAEFYARFQILKNKNVLFPFGFHGTGMPIVTSANKLKESLIKYENDILDIDKLNDSDQIKILYNMDIPPNEIAKFTNPYYWLEYFPVRAIKDLTSFGLCADFSRSFVTTDINPHFDSFVKWQFNKLNKAGHLIFGKKSIIFSPKNKQACSDDDRSKGEGVGIKEYFVYYAKLNQKTKLIITSEIELKENKIKHIIIDINDEFKLFTVNGEQFIARTEFIRNLKYQLTDEIIVNFNMECDDIIGSTVIFENRFNLEVIQSKYNNIGGSGFKFLFEKEEGTNEKINYQCKYYEPMSEIISRSGDKCVVAIKEQWFINYGDEKLKNKIDNYIKNDLIINDIAKSMLLAGSEWIKEWPCSRSCGLGTKLLDTDYLIDSLSDSTIYMAYYTIAHKINNIPINILNNEVWEFILCDGPRTNIEMQYQKLLLELKNEFKYWYSMDLRVSAKDLSMNHLVMCLYNHLMIWGNLDMMPKRYFINGYVLLNGEKMSKSKGIFMTLENAINKFGADPTRIALASAGSGMDDANFVEQNANSAILRLDTEKEFCKQIIDYIKISNYDFENTFWDDLFENDILICTKNTEEMFNDMNFHAALTVGFYNMLTIRDNYRNKCNSNIIKINPKSMLKFLNNFLLVTYPIAPHFVEHLWNYASDNGIILNKLWPNDYTINSKLSFFKNIFDNIIKTTRNNITQLLKKNKTNKTNKTKEQIKFDVKINMFNTFSNEEYNVFKIVKDSINTNIEWKQIQFDIMNNIIDKKKLGNYGKFLTFIKTSIEIYGNAWLTYIDNIEEMNVLHKIVKYWLPKIMLDNNINDFDISCENGNDLSSFKFNMTNPNVIIKH